MFTQKKKQYYSNILGFKNVYDFENFAKRYLKYLENQTLTKKLPLQLPPLTFRGNCPTPVTMRVSAWPVLKTYLAKPTSVFL